MSPVASTSLVGQVVDGRYRVQSHLADGGMASVYTAVDLRLERDVALKIMRPDLARDESFVSRFQREARSAARLSHPHVVGVFDQGTDGASVFLVMELVAGRNLREVIRGEGPLTVRAALDLIEPVLQALEAAHRAGLVHRDIKPENVLLGENGVVKVADFGLARAVTTETVTSHTDVLLGTAAYLSPEQVERGVADPRSDIYSAGLVLSEMLTGVKAFPGDSPIHVAYQHVHGQVPPPSSRVTSIPAAVDELVAHATATDPDDRPASASALLDEVRRCRAALTPAELDGRPVRGDSTRTQEPTMALGETMTREVRAGARQPADPRREPPAASRSPRRGRRRWAIALFAFALLLGLGAVGGWYIGDGPGARATVPMVANLPQAGAVAALELRHLGATPVQAFSENVRSGIVISSDPAAGESTRRGSSVELTVSKGPERYLVPALVGLSRAEATARLKARHLTLGAVSEAYDETRPQGQVLSSTPPQRSSLKRSAKVGVTVSRGPAPITVTRVVGQTKDAATATLTKLGLTVDASAEDFSTDVPQGSVTAQTPDSGTLHRGDSVQLTISKGPQLVKVPDVGGKQADEAERILTAAGFVVDYRKILGGVFQTVRLQEPNAGTMAPRGSTVTLTIV